MIPIWQYERIGQVKYFLGLFNIVGKATCDVELYRTNRGDAMGLNFSHPHLDMIEEKLQEFMIVKALEPSDCEVNEAEYVSPGDKELYKKWRQLASWRIYVQRFGYSGGYTTYADELDEDDITCLRSSLYEFRTDDGLERIEKYAERNECLKAEKEIHPLLEKSEELVGKLKRYVRLVAKLCDYVSAKHNARLASALKIPAKKIHDHQELADTYTLVQKIKGFTEESTRVVDAFDELCAITKKAQQGSATLRELRDALKVAKWDC